MSGPGALEISVTVPRRGFDVSVDLYVEPGERLALFGPSGAGKTTVVDTAAGFTDPSAGSVRLDDVVISRPAGATAQAGRRGLRRTFSGSAPPAATVEHVSAVRQPATLFPHLDVASNVSYGRSDAALAARLTERLDLSEHRHARPSALSGGQVQRVALARALGRRFSLLLLDEPVSALDSATRSACYEVIADRCAEERAIAVLVTHELHEAQAFGDRLAIMDAGGVLAVGDPHALVAAPPTRRVAELVGYRSFLRLRDTTGGRQLELAIDPAQLRPCDSVPGDAGIALRGRVASCRPAGPRFLLSISVAKGTTVETTLSGSWVTALTCELPMLLTAPVTMGKETLVTAPWPPVFAA
jgi:ABC-type Fe3+/spermidine/putrescine transport system ATPase subunit